MRALQNPSLQKSVWRVLTENNLWVQVVMQNCIHLLTTMEWIRLHEMNTHDISNSWKEILNAFDTVGNGKQIRLGPDYWIDNNNQHSLP